MQYGHIIEGEGAVYIRTKFEASVVFSSGSYFRGTYGSHLYLEHLSESVWRRESCFWLSSYSDFMDAVFESVHKLSIR